MRLGVFDSGLGGLIITRAIRENIPDIDILYYGDTLHLPYGNRSDDAIFMYTQRAMNHMFSRGCQLIVIACNTASVSALRRLQQTWLRDAWPGRNILGVVVPTLETAIELGCRRLGLIATNYSIRTNSYALELKKINPQIEIMQKATPLLVPLIENGGLKWIDEVLRDYLEPILAENIDALLLGCTHYAFLKSRARKIAGENVTILSQDEIIPAKLTDYLRRHPEHNGLISRNGATEFEVSDLTEGYVRTAREIYGGEIEIRKAA